MFRWSFKSGSPSTGGGAGGARSTRELNQATQRRFARGVDCNMKVLIRGERKTGKSSLLARLQAKSAPREYKQTPQIDVANISWKYKSTPGVVKVELWDVVDQGIPSTAELPTGEPVPCLDASFIDDIYKGVHGVIFLFDVAKPWTFKYVEREMLSVPPTIPVLILANFQDAATPTSTTLDEVQAAVSTVPRPRNAAGIYCAAASVVNDFGLSFVNKFFGMPYLYVQRLWHEAQLKANRTEAGNLDSELTTIGPDAEEQNYTKFVERREARQAEKARAAREAELKKALEAQEQEQQGKQSVFARMRSTFVAKRPEQQQPQQQKTQQQQQQQQQKKAGSGGVTSVDEFVPDEELPDDFFGDEDGGGSTTATTADAKTQQRTKTKGGLDGGGVASGMGGAVQVHAGTAGPAAVLQDDDDEEEEEDESDGAGNQLVMADISDFEDDDSDVNVGAMSDTDASSDEGDGGGGGRANTSEKEEKKKGKKDKRNADAQQPAALRRAEGGEVIAPPAGIVGATKTESATDAAQSGTQQQQEGLELEGGQRGEETPSLDVPVPAAHLVEGDSEDDDEDAGPNPLLMADEDVSDDELKVDVDDDLEVSDDSEADEPPPPQQQQRQQGEEGLKGLGFSAGGEHSEEQQAGVMEMAAAKEKRNESSGDGVVVSGTEEGAKKKKKKKKDEDKRDKEKKGKKKKKKKTGQKSGDMGGGETVDDGDKGNEKQRDKSKKKKKSKKGKKKAKGEAGGLAMHSDGGNSELDAFLNDAPYSPSGSKPGEHDDDEVGEGGYDDSAAPSMPPSGDYVPL